MNVDVNVFFLHTWQLESCADGIIWDVFVDVHPWSQEVGFTALDLVLVSGVSTSPSGESLIEEAIEVRERLIIEAGERHF